MKSLVLGFLAKMSAHKRAKQAMIVHGEFLYYFRKSKLSAIQWLPQALSSYKHAVNLYRNHKTIRQVPLQAVAASHLELGDLWCH